MVTIKRDNAVSIWVGTTRPDYSDDTDILKDVFGVEYYDIDYQDVVGNEDYSEVPIEDLLGRLSYSSSFKDAAIVEAKNRGLTSARWVLAQYKLAYDSSQGKTTGASDPVFLGVFDWNDSEDDELMREWGVK